MNLLLVIATDEQRRLEAALRGHLDRAFPGDVREVDANRLPSTSSDDALDVQLARELLVADAVIMLLPLVNERRSLGSMQTWLHRAGVDGVTMMVEPDGITGLLDEKPVFLICPLELDHEENEEEAIRSARNGLAKLGLRDVTVIDVDPAEARYPGSGSFDWFSRN